MVTRSGQIDMDLIYTTEKINTEVIQTETETLRKKKTTTEKMCLKSLGCPHCCTMLWLLTTGSNCLCRNLNVKRDIYIFIKIKLAFTSIDCWSPSLKHGICAIFLTTVSMRDWNKVRWSYRTNVRMRPMRRSSWNPKTTMKRLERGIIIWGKIIQILWEKKWVYYIFIRSGY